MQHAQIRAKVNHDTGFTGIVAVICMLIDHMGVVFFPQQAWMRVVGRIALPLFAWGIAVGAEHTRNIARYALRLFIMALISQPFYAFALNHAVLATGDLWTVLKSVLFSWGAKYNIFAVLFLGLLGIWGLKDNKGWLAAIALLVSHFVPMDYGFRGVLCILLLWAARDNPLALAVTFSAFCVVWGESSAPSWTTPYFTVRLQSWAILALPFMLIPRAKRTPTPRWLMYAVYPAHLAVIWAIKAFI